MEALDVMPTGGNGDADRAKIDAVSGAEPTVTTRTRLAPSMSPTFPDVGILALVPEDWGVLWDTRRQLLSRLARHFRVVWVNPPRSWRESRTGDRDARRGLDQPAASARIDVYDHGRLLPKLYRPAVLAGLVERWRLKRARRILKRAGCRKIILYIWRPEFGTATDTVAHDLAVYHIDDEYSFSPVEIPPDPEELALIRRADLVFIHSPALLEKKGRINPRTLWIPNGVDFAGFSAPHPVPPELAAVRRPIMGYAGSMKRHLDFAVLLALASAHPEWSFVFVGRKEALRGDDAAAAERLFDLPNVHDCGFQSLERLPAFIGAFDVCLLPYKVNGYTKFIYPLKLHEYLATGRPVVGAPIRTVTDFSDVIHVAHDVPDWSAACAASLSPAATAPARTDARRRAAADFDWNRLAAKAAEALCSGLAGDYPARWRSRQGTAETRSRAETPSR